MQLQIARALIPRLAARQNRVGLASVSFRARTNGTSLVRLTEKRAFTVPVGDPDAVLEALEDSPAAHERRWTDLTRLLELGAELLDDTRPFLTDWTVHSARPRVILLLSLGVPSAPDGIYWSSRSAVERAGELGERGIALWAIPLGSADPAFLSELTRGSGGKVLPLDQLDAQFGAPVFSNLVPRELEIENITKHAQATRLRVFPDGRFEAVVPLEPGPNTLEIRAVLADGHRTTIRRLVHYDPATRAWGPFRAPAVAIVDRVAHGRAFYQPYRSRSSSRFSAASNVDHRICVPGQVRPRPRPPGASLPPHEVGVPDGLDLSAIPDDVLAVYGVPDVEVKLAFTRHGRVVYDDPERNAPRARAQTRAPRAYTED